MHPVTRLGRVIQQLRSFSDLHAGELEGLAVELDAAGAGEVAQRLRGYRDVQRDEAMMVMQVAFTGLVVAVQSDSNVNHALAATRHAMARFDDAIGAVEARTVPSLWDRFKGKEIRKRLP